jgi:hypothetical protein
MPKEPAEPPPVAMTDRFRVPFPMRYGAGPPEADSGGGGFFLYHSLSGTGVLPEVVRPFLARLATVTQFVAAEAMQWTEGGAPHDWNDVRAALSLLSARGLIERLED